MSFDKTQFRDLINRVLERIDMHSPDAVDLLMGTAAQESHLGTYLKQKRGPALGIFQMEPATEQDIWNNYLAHRPEYIERLFRVAHVFYPTAWELETNLAYQIAMARYHYWRVPLRLPHSTVGAARYWKKYYNTNAGKGTLEQYLKNYKRFCK